MQKLKENISSIILCLCELIIGILLLIDPVGFTSGIITTVGIVLIVTGILKVIQYFRTDPAEAALQQSLTKGIIAILLGYFCTLRANWVIMTFPILSILYGIAILFSGLCKIQWAVDFLRLKRKYWFVAGIGAVLSIVLSIVILVNPFATAIIMWRFIAISLIIEAVLDICALIIGAAAHSNTPQY
ncbi:MAG: DUF308 domain-containing protein [Roseburia sp.]|nr:DUF308 domain-containing protein [Roseburia sp.]